MVLENSRMKQPTSAIAAPTQKMTQFGAGFEIGKAMPPITKPTIAMLVPT
jgi:hypothetical protein